MTVGQLTIRLVIREARSLKEKRRILRSLKDRVRNRHNVSIAEVDHQDLHQSALIAVAMVGTDRSYVNGGLSKVVDLVEGTREVEVVGYELEFF